MPCRRRTLHLIASCCVAAAGCDSLAGPGSPDVPPGVWTASGEPPEVVYLDPGQLRQDGDAAPAKILTTPDADLFTLNAVAFDRYGALWVASFDDARLLAFGPEALAQGGEESAMTRIESVGGSLRSPSGLAFDAAGRLWVANHAGGTLVRFDREQLAIGGAVSPAVVLAIGGKPTGLAFDGWGALWVSDNDANVIRRYDAKRLEVSGAPVASGELRAEGDECFLHPAGLAFDRSGTLWVANVGCDDVVGLSPSRPGRPAPPPLIAKDDQGALSIPVGLAFDEEGDLWVMSGLGSLTELAGSSLARGGAPTVSTRLRVQGHTLMWSLALWPRPRVLRLPPQARPAGSE